LYYFIFKTLQPTFFGEDKRELATLGANHDEHFN
jgi:hypothetical protein